MGRPKGAISNKFYRYKVIYEGRSEHFTTQVSIKEKYPFCNKSFCYKMTNNKELVHTKNMQIIKLETPISVNITTRRCFRDQEEPEQEANPQEPELIPDQAEVPVSL